MFHKLQMKLSFICCLITTLIVLIIILCCLKVSERTMYGQEKALFLLKTNTISSDLHLSENITINWYRETVNTNKNILYIEANGSPTTLSSLLLSEKELSYIHEIRKYIKSKEFIADTKTDSSNICWQSFKYTKDKHKFLVMDAKLSENEQEIAYIFLYSLDDFYHNINRQRVRFLLIWFVSILILYVFSYIFTARVLKPIIENDERQKHFVAFASHELRSPLAVFKMGLSILKNKPDTNKTTHIFSLMENEMSRMERLIQDLLSLSKMENGRLSFHFVHVNLADLLTSIYEKYIVAAEDKQITLSLSTTADCNYDCLCDCQRVEQAIIILLDNALTYTPPGQSITLNLYYSRKKYYIQVIDTGIGIPDSEKEKIFDRFYQVNSSHSHKEHFGLGLSIAKEICHTHGGKISVSDTKGGGSTFTIKLSCNTNSHT